jgi:uncharacterized membrane protein
MKFAGHPIHVMVIHFPAALLPMELGLSALAYYHSNTSFSQAAFYCLLAGVAIGLLAMLTGLIDLVRIPKEEKEALGTGLVHGFINGVIILTYAIFAYRAWKSGTAAAIPSTGMLVFKCILVICLFTGNYFGGKLIYKHRMGLNKIN